MATKGIIKSYEFLPEVNLSDLSVDPLNSRSPEAVRGAGFDALKTNIQNVGLIHPITVTEIGNTKKYKILVGQRRYTAFQDLGHKTIPAILLKDKLSDRNKRLISFSENANRARLPYNDTIRLCDELYSRYTGPESKRLEKVSEEAGLPISVVTRYLSYRIVPKEVRDMVEQKKIDPSQAYKLTSVFWPKTQKIVKIAKYMLGMSKPEWQNLYAVGAEMRGDSSAEEVIEESKKPSRRIPIKFWIERSDFEKITEIANESENKVDVSELIGEIIKGYLRGQ